MIRIVWVVLVVALAWSLYWLVGSSTLERGLRASLDEMRASGWTVVLDDLTVRGFPNRFDTTLTAPRLTEPQTATTWEAPFVQILALSYRPNRIIAILPHIQRLRGPLGDAVIRTDRARGSVTLQPVPDLMLDHSQFVIENLAVESAGVTLRMDELLLATRLPAGSEDGTRQNIGITIRNLDLPATMTDAFDDASDARLGFATLDATVGFDAPIDRHALNETLRVTGLDVERLAVDWGAASLSGEGSVAVGADGLLVGTLDLRLENWSGALDLATTLGMVPPKMAPRIRQGVTLLTALGDAPATLSLPLSFRDGDMYLGPLPLGPAPRLWNGSEPS